MESLFTIGQKVVCVDSSYRCGFPSPLIEGKTYTISAIMKCKCGIIEVDVSTPNPSDVGGLICVTCKSIKFYPNWTHVQTRFIPLDFDRQADSEIHEALKGKAFISSKPDNQ